MLTKKIRYSANTLCFKNIKEANLIFPIPSDIIEHDYYLALCFSLFGNIQYINKPLIEYRVHSNNISGNYALETTNGYRNYKKIIKKNKNRSNKIIKNDIVILEKHIKEKLNRDIQIKVVHDKKGIKNLIKQKIPLFHYMYIQIILKKKFSAL